MGKNVWQQCSRDVLCLLRGIPARVFQFMREDPDEAIIIRWLSAEVPIPLFPDWENRLQWSSAPIRLDPVLFGSIYGAGPNSHLVSTEFWVGNFKHDAANIFVFEEIVSSKLHAIEIAVYVEKERIAAPTEEKMEVADLCHQGFLSDGHRGLLDDNFTFLTHTTCLHPLK